ncbi:MAG: tRNA pseudouridine(38-40) synthase TruA [Elusimicrobia bacterium CG08_land_8_20_14_0_20_44_26]|nr:MAG: tRNA pseudouridine(38-40) synthase TruA [Elusimicrobia bacterium CG08_land_8_20_14_0_20_44_26]
MPFRLRKNLSKLSEQLNNFKLSISYDGSKFFGSQIQKQNPTIAGEIFRAISKTVQDPDKVSLIFASRTDRGVHARCNVCSFKSNTNIRPSAMKRALNSRLTKYIRINTVSLAVDENFNPRFDCVSKIYRYYFRAGGYSPYHADYCLKIPERCDRQKMAEAASRITGVKDFRFFSSCSSRENTVCRIFDCFVSKGKNLFYIQIEGLHFLYKMARTIASFVVECGVGKINPDDFDKIIGGREKRVEPAAPGGLYLWKVKYR